MFVSLCFVLFDEKIIVIEVQIMLKCWIKNLLCSVLILVSYMAYFLVHSLAHSLYLDTSVLYNLAISGTNGSSGLGSHNNEHIDNSTCNSNNVKNSQNMLNNSYPLICTHHMSVLEVLRIALLLQNLFEICFYKKEKTEASNDFFAADKEDLQYSECVLFLLPLIL